MEEHFKNKLKNHKVDWDKEELLFNIQKELDHESSLFDKRWLLLLPVLLVSTCWGLQKMQSSSDVKPVIQHTDSYGSKSSDLANNANEISLDRIKQSIVDPENVDQISQESSSVSKVVDQKNKKTSLNRSLASTEENELNYLSTTSIVSTNNNAYSKTNVKSFNNRSLENDKTTQIESQTVNNGDEMLSKSIAQSVADENSIILIEQLPFIEFDPILLDRDIYILALPNKVILEDVELDDSKSSHLYASLIGNAGSFYRSASASNDSGPDVGELALNRETLNARLALSTNLNFGYQHQSGWFLESGLGYNRLYETLDLVDTLGYSETEVEFDKAFYFLHGNDTIFRSGIATVSDAEIRKVIHNNHHSYYTLPLTVGYRYSLGGVDVSPSLGVSYAFRNSFKGREAQVVEAEQRTVIDDPTFEFRNRLGFRFGLGVEYPLAERLRFLANINYRRSPSLSRGAIDQVYQVYSLGVGFKVIME